MLPYPWAIAPVLPSVFKFSRFVDADQGACVLQRLSCVMFGKACLIQCCPSMLLHVSLQFPASVREASRVMTLSPTWGAPTTLSLLSSSVCLGFRAVTAACTYMPFLYKALVCRRCSQSWVSALVDLGKEKEERGVVSRHPYSSAFLTCSFFPGWCLFSGEFAVAFKIFPKWDV